MPSPRVLRAAAILLVLAACGTSAAQLPQTRLGWIFPAGGRAGTAFEVRVGGERDLEYETVPQLTFGHPAITATAKVDPGTGAWRDNAFEVTIGADVPAGRYEVMLDGYYGTSNPRAFRVEADAVTVESSAGELRRLALDEPAYGWIGKGAEADSYAFAGSVGQTVVVRVDARGLDSPLQPVVDLIGPDGRQISSAGGPYAGETTFAATLPAAGDYTVRLADAAYRGGVEFTYRLEVTSRPVVAFVWPPAGVRGESGAFELFGYNLPGGDAVHGQPQLIRKKVGIELPIGEGGRPESASLAVSQISVDGFDYVLRDSGTASNPVPIFFAPQRLALEVEPNDGSAEGQRVAVPGELAGRFDRKGDADRFLFEAKKGEAFVVEVFAERYGSGADPVVAIDRVGGPEGKPPERLAVQDDQQEGFAAGLPEVTTRDPVVRFEAPEEGVYAVTVRDRYSSSRGGPNLFYRLSIRRPEPDFHLAIVPALREKAGGPATAGSIVVRRNESVAVMVVAFRRDGFDGPIEIRAEGLPAGVASDGVTLGTGSNSASLVVTAANDAAEWRGPVTVFGEASVAAPDGASKSLRREAVAVTLFGSGKDRATTARLAGPLVVSVLDEAAPFRLVRPGGTARVAQGSQVLVPLRIEGRGAGADRRPSGPISVVAEGIASDAKIVIESKSFEPGVVEQVARLVVDSKAPPRSHAVVFRATGKTEYAAFPHRLKRAKLAQQAAAERVKTSADGETEEVRKQAEAGREAADRAVAQAEKAAVQTVDYSSPAAALSLTVVPASADLTVDLPDGGRVKREEAIEIKIAVKRRNGFEGAISLELAVPAVTGLAAAPTVIPAGQMDGSLKVTAGNDAAEGDVSFPAVRARFDTPEAAPLDVPLTLKVVP